ncbi:MAG: hypothetical protein ABIN61_00415 [candidate division WOR-3 bacterium]
MSTNKIVGYLLFLIFIIAFYVTLPKEPSSSFPKIEINFKKKKNVEIPKIERDPFRYKTNFSGEISKFKKTSSITIKAILWDPKKPSAAISINGEKTIFVKEGDKINNIKILKIYPDKIIVDEYGKKTINFK